MRARVLQIMAEIAEDQGKKLCDAIDEDSVLLQTGVDSLGFAILVARLEEEFGIDPFVAMVEPVYPRTFGEFLRIYESHRSTL